MTRDRSGERLPRAVGLGLCLARGHARTWDKLKEAEQGWTAGTGTSTGCQQRSWLRRPSSGARVYRQLLLGPAAPQFSLSLAALWETGDARQPHQPAARLVSNSAHVSG